MQRSTTPRTFGQRRLTKLGHFNNEQELTCESRKVELSSPSKSYFKILQLGGIKNAG